MFAPDYYITSSVLAKLSTIHGSREFIDEIERFVCNEIDSGTDLYETQDKISAYLKSKYGSAWFNKSVEAVMFLVETAYASDFNQKHPILDKEQWENDMKSGIMY